MAKQIMVSDEVYDALKREKNGKSFSEIIKEKVIARPKKPNLMEFFGVINDREASRLRRASKEFRKNFKPRKFTSL